LITPLNAGVSGGSTARSTVATASAAQADAPRQVVRIEGITVDSFIAANFIVFLLKAGRHLHPNDIAFQAPLGVELM
jgi:hypothetical protein